MSNATNEIATPCLIDEVLERILNGETALYAEVVRMYDKYLYKIGRSYGYDHQTTEDLMQETFVNAYVHLKDFKSKSSFKTWIVQIMLHECYHKKQKAAHRLEVYTPERPDEKMTPVFGTNARNVDEIVNNHELKGNIEKAIVQIPEKYRSVFILRELSEMSVHDTATSLGITETNVKARLNRAKTMLRTQLSKTYSPEDIFAFNLIYCDALVERVMKAIEKIEIEGK
ncbi:MAG: sigma-70 family RNA polymerase sigma factor [Chitinophagaceae bacterium]